MLLVPAKYDSPEMQEYLKGRLKFKGPCNYCSCRELNPLELTLDSAELNGKSHTREELRTVRNYMFGFTFAPFGDPREVKHFLAWDYPHIKDVINNMDPQVYSFSDLIKLVNTINEGLELFCKAEGLPFQPINGVCNHWAGNSIYHQHYQFFAIDELPMLKAPARNEVTAYREVAVERLEWESPAYRIKAGSDASVKDLMFVADKVANEWNRLNGTEKDMSYGNGIEISNHTQNIVVTRENGQAVAYFIPRERSKLDTRGNDVIQKKNAAVLEMMGYFLVDNPADLDILNSLVPKQLLAPLLKDQKVKPEELLASLQRAGFVGADRKINKDKLAESKFELDVELSDAVLENVHRMLKLIPTDAKGRKELAQRWLSDLSPSADKIEKLETSLKQFLKEKVVSYEQMVQNAADHLSIDSRKRSLMEVAVAIMGDVQVNADQTSHLLSVLNQAYAEKADLQRSPLLTGQAIQRVVAEKTSKLSKVSK